MGRGLAAGVVAVAVILAGLAVWLVAEELPDFWDPCRTWGLGGSGNLTLSPDDECPSLSGTSETRQQRAAVLAGIHGSTVVASALAIIGTWRRRSWPLAVAAALMLGVSVLLLMGFSFTYPLTLGTSVLYLVAALRWRRTDGPGATTVPEGS